jgi:hypothetical protein
MPSIQRRFMASTSIIELDAHDTRILAELQADARLTMAELGRPPESAGRD